MVTRILLSLWLALANAWCVAACGAQKAAPPPCHESKQEPCSQQMVPAADIAMVFVAITAPQQPEVAAESSAPAPLSQQPKRPPAPPGSMAVLRI